MSEIVSNKPVEKIALYAVYYHRETSGQKKNMKLYKTRDLPVILNYNNTRDKRKNSIKIYMKRLR